MCYNTWNVVRHLGIFNRICVKLLQLMCAVITYNSVKKNEMFILINGWVTANHGHGRHFVRNVEIYNSICVKLSQIMSGGIPRNLWKNDSPSQTVFLASTNAAYTHRPTDTHDDSVRRNAMRCISPKNEITYYHLDISNGYFIGCQCRKSWIWRLTTPKIMNSYISNNNKPIKVVSVKSLNWRFWPLNCAERAYVYIIFKIFGVIPQDPLLASERQYYWTQN